jgi:hypothetical protein
MSRNRWALAALTAAAVAAGGTVLTAGQLPLAPVARSGEGVTPVFEGWYANADGTLTLSFGYFNRNLEEIVDIPVGPNNRFESGAANRDQPTHFLPRRQWGVFGVKIPADFGDQKLVWTLKIRGKTYSIPGHLDRGYYIDALEGEAGAQNTPPVIRFGPDDPGGSGPGGSYGPSMTVAVGEPLSLTVWATDDARSEPYWHRRSSGDTLDLTWHKHQGGGDVLFANSTPAIDRADGGKATTTAIFNSPGQYILRVLANDVSGTSAAGHAQCCWTNSFVRVTVNPSRNQP